MFGKKKQQKRWDRSQYPDNWEEISYSFRELKDFTCEHCGVRQGTMRESKAGNPYTARTAAAHKWPNDTQNPEPELLCLCESCHRKYDNQFQELIDEGEHQAVMHDILLERRADEEEWEYCDICEMRLPDSHFPHGG